MPERKKRSHKLKVNEMARVVGEELGNSSSLRLTYTIAACGVMVVRAPYTCSEFTLEIQAEQKSKLSQECRNV